MKQLSIVVLVLSSLLLRPNGLCNRLYAFPNNEAMPLPQAASFSEVVVVASLEKYTPNKSVKLPVERDAKPNDTILGAKSFNGNTTSKIDTGTFDFRVLSNLKGRSESKLEGNFSISLPDYIYSSSFNFKEKDEALLFLKSTPLGWKPVDPMVPLIKVARGSYLKHENSVDTLVNIVDVLVGSLSDSSLRREISYRMRYIVNPKVVEALDPYIEDTNLVVRGNVLYCLAVNQDVKAIKPIANLQEELSARDSGAEALVALQRYKTPEAVPHLNPLLFSWDEYIRINTAITLQRLANISSIPYLVLALYDPETQGVVSYSAYRTLHRLIPTLGRPSDPTFFKVRREAETARVLRWWREELNSKQATRTLELHIIKVDVTTLPLKQLHSLLFDPSAELRRNGMSALQNQLTVVSIPYLMLTLQDPDIDVAYGGYSALHSLIPKIKIPQTRATFEAQRSKVIEPLMKWWEDELLARHLTQPK